MVTTQNYYSQTLTEIKTEDCYEDFSRKNV